MKRATARRSAIAFGTAAFVGMGLIALPVAAGNLSGWEGANTRHDADNTSTIANAIKTTGAKNVILLIGDGMGDSEITIARNYRYGAAGKLPGIDALPLTGSYTTYSLYKEGENKGKPDYVPDSAATGSAWATGVKTYDNAISVDIDGRAQNTLIELAKANGLRTGNVSTAEIQDATPAVQVAHVAARSCYGPDSTTCGDDALIEGGLGSISEQLLNTRADVTLGGGSASFDQTAKAGAWSGKTLFQQAKERGYRVATSADQLAKVTKATQTHPVLGLFTPGNFPTRYAATTATVGGADLAPITCTTNPDRLTKDLSLKSLTTKAISLLDNKKSSNGFFLQVEGASIDKRDHSADACGQIGETIDLDEAVRAALAFAKKDGHTLVIVTADHAHSSQIVDSTPPTSLSTAVLTADGVPMKVSYGTAAAGGSQQHTGSQVRIAAYGPGAANVVGLTDQTDTFFTIANSLDLNRSLAALSKGAKLSVSDRTVSAGQRVTLSMTGFAGDRQLRRSVNSVGTIDLDLLRGGVTTSFIAPTKAGTYRVLVVGEQTGKRVATTIRVQ